MNPHDLSRNLFTPNYLQKLFGMVITRDKNTINKHAPQNSNPYLSFIKRFLVLWVLEVQAKIVFSIWTVCGVVIRMVQSFLYYGGRRGDECGEYYAYRNESEGEGNRIVSLVGFIFVTLLNSSLPLQLIYMHRNKHGLAYPTLMW